MKTIDIFVLTPSPLVPMLQIIVKFIHWDWTERNIIFAFLKSFVGLKLFQGVNIFDFVLFLVFLTAWRSLW